MLGRTANSLFWMFRYLERAENTARLLEAALRMALTRDLVTAEAEWRSVIATLGLQHAYEAAHEAYDGASVWNFVLRGPANPGNVRNMFGAVRSNARAARINISSDVWEAVNENWMKLDAMLARPVGQTSVGDVLGAIRRAGTQVHGAFDGSMLRDEGYHFSRAGTFIERADSTARILDMKYFLLLPSLSYVGSSLDTGQWEQVLRSVAGARVYSWLNAGQIEARGIVEFLVLDDRFPRSLAFCRNALRDNLAALARMHREEGRAVALMRDADTRISHLTVDQIFEAGLHEFLVDFLARNAAIAQAIAGDYRFHA
ncbi:alpha-E domain-containing protein [Erythrobacter sp. BLCC-B19]|uniref:alpha-E domain-containing protein n=1 Tax=Erythrobacter sp. BLCC-B19 TaxID=3025315 RepID=UPI00235E4564|nr:alpha-E domain-containing protein [Erythrobacter sp. BLCC-B19]WDA41211.1 alpha-E domain-containing protein [Erythrobacter sp. BLCC-B19]